MKNILDKIKNTLNRINNAIWCAEQRSNLKASIKKYDYAVMVPCERMIGQRKLQYMRVYGYLNNKAVLLQQSSNESFYNVWNSLRLELQMDCPYPKRDSIL